jgi:hypothetical protein
MDVVQAEELQTKINVIKVDRKVVGHSPHGLVYLGAYSDACSGQTTYPPSRCEEFRNRWVIKEGTDEEIPR